MSQIEDKIKNIGTISTWLLGFLAIIIAAMVSFIFNDLSEIIVQHNFPTLEYAVLALLGSHSLIACSILLVLIISFAFIHDKKAGLEKRAKLLIFLFKVNVTFAAITLLAVFGFVAYFLYS